MKIMQVKSIINTNMNLCFFTFIFTLGGCASMKGGMTDKGDLNTAVHNAINDFLNSVKKEKSDKIFYISAKSVNQDLFGVSFEATNDKVVVITEDRVNFSYRALPAGYVDRDGRLFYWYDSTKQITANEEMISTLKKYNILDTLIVGAVIPESTIAHGKKGTDYFFCKKNLLKYKKIRTSKALGFYPLPQINCE